jgi:hypothetical protein
MKFLLRKYVNKPSEDGKISIPESVVNHIRNKEELELLCNKGNEEDRKVDFLWNSKSFISPRPAFEYNSEFESYGDDLFETE